MNVKMVDRIAATIRRADGGHKMGAGALAEAIVVDLGNDDAWDAETVEQGIAALIADGWSETHDGGTLDHQDMVNIVRVVLCSVFE